MTLIAERGYADASTRELARRLGMSQPSLYHYFDSKEELVSRIIQSHAEQAFQERDAAPAEPPVHSARDLFRVVLDHLIASWERPSHLTFTRFLIAVHLYRPDLSAGLREQILDLSFAPLHAPIERLAQEHGVSEADLEGALRLAVDTLVGRFLQAQLLGIRPTASASLRDEVDFLIEVVLHGVLNRSDRPSTVPPGGR